MAHTAQHHHRQHGNRLLQGERFRRDKALEGTKQRPGHAAKRGTHGKGQQLKVAHVDPHRPGDVFIFANGVPRPANARVLQAQTDKNDPDNHQHQQVVPQPQGGHLDAEPVVHPAELQPKQVESIDAGNALSAVGDVHRAVEITHQNTDDLPEAEGHDRQIIAAQLQRWRTEQDAAYRCDQRGNRDDQQIRRM